jgi:hypothetical protein
MSNQVRSTNALPRCSVGSARVSELPRRAWDPAMQRTLRVGSDLRDCLRRALGVTSADDWPRSLRLPLAAVSICSSPAYFCASIAQPSAPAPSGARAGPGIGGASSATFALQGAPRLRALRFSSHRYGSLRDQQCHLNATVEVLPG